METSSQASGSSGLSNGNGGSASRGQWATRTGFILAAAGSAVGLGNLWKFPYITGENGGGWFVLIYLICIALVGIPIMMAEIMIGRAARKQPVAAFEELQGGKTAWSSVGWLGVIAGFVILSYYIVVAGWAMDFTLKSAVNITQPIHEEAEREGIRYRVTATPDDMRAMLVERMAEREARPDIARLTHEARPSVWEAYDLYTAGLSEAGALNIAEIEALLTAWAGDPPELIRALGMESELAVRITDSQRQAYAEARSVLFEREDLREKVPVAEEVVGRFAQARRARLLEAHEHYSSYTDQALRDEAEPVHRRQVIFDQVQEAFVTVATDGWTASFWAALFMLITILIVAGGISGGIERTCRTLMPTLFVLIIIMVIYGALKPGFGEAVAFIFKPDITRLEPSGVLEALGHAFFTLSLGMGAMITYGSYQQTKTKLVGQSVTIAGLDTGVALLACLMIFPITFSYDQEPSAGPGLVFMSMPLAFAEIGRGGMLLAILFFGLVTFAALTSAISLLEVVASYFIDKIGWTRRRATWLLGVVILAFGLPSAFAMDPEFMMPGWNPSYGVNFFDTMDYLASNWMLPLGGLFIAIYAGWVMPARWRKAEMADVGPLVTTVWLLLVRFIAPALVILVLCQKVGLIDANELLHGLFH